MHTRGCQSPPLNKSTFSEKAPLEQIQAFDIDKHLLIRGQQNNMSRYHIFQVREFDVFRLVLFVNSQLECAEHGLAVKVFRHCTLIWFQSTCVVFERQWTKSVQSCLDESDEPYGCQRTVSLVSTVNSDAHSFEPISLLTRTSTKRSCANHNQTCFHSAGAAYRPGCSS